LFTQKLTLFIDNWTLFTYKLFYISRALIGLFQGRKFYTILGSGMALMGSCSKHWRLIALCFMGIYNKSGKLSFQIHFSFTQFHSYRLMFCHWYALLLLDFDFSRSVGSIYIQRRIYFFFEFQGFFRGGSNLRCWRSKIGH